MRSFFPAFETLTEVANTNRGKKMHISFFKLPGALIFALQSDDEI